MSAAAKVYLALGSNIQPEVNIPDGLSALARAFKFLLAHSTAWQSAAVGSQGPDFLNAVTLIRTTRTAAEIKTDVLQPLEIQMGRVRQADKNAPRTIDLDVLLYDDCLLDDSLWHSAHLAVPLAELNPEYLHPTTARPLSEYAQALRKTVTIRKRPDVLKLYLPSKGQIITG